MRGAQYKDLACDPVFIAEWQSGVALVVLAKAYGCTENTVRRACGHAAEPLRGVSKARLVAVSLDGGAVDRLSGQFHCTVRAARRVIHRKGLCIGRLRVDQSLHQDMVERDRRQKAARALSSAARKKAKAAAVCRAKRSKALAVPKPRVVRAVPVRVAVPFAEWTSERDAVLRATKGRYQELRAAARQLGVTDAQVMRRWHAVRVAS